MARFDKPDGSKEFRPASRNEHGWVLSDPAGSLPLYRLNEIPPTGPVIVTEGEKCADAAWSIGLPAVTSPHGARSAGKADWSALGGRDVIILPDNDEAGRSYAAEVARILTSLDPPAQVKVVELPDLPVSGDVVDYLDNQKNVEPERLRARILKLAEAVPK